MRLKATYFLFLAFTVSGQATLAAPSTFEKSKELQYVCASDKTPNIQIRVNKHRKKILLLTRSEANTEFLKNGDFICKDAADIEINPDTSKILICGDHPVETGESIMGLPVREVPHLQISNGYSYKITFSQRNIFSSSEVLLDVTSPSGKNHTLSFRCRKL